MIGRRNLSWWDRWLRIGLGVAMIVTGVLELAGGLWDVGLQLFAWAPLLTGLLGWSPLYAILGLSTGGRRRHPDEDWDDWAGLDHPDEDL